MHFSTKLQQLEGKSTSVGNGSVLDSLLISNFGTIFSTFVSKKSLFPQNIMPRRELRFATLDNVKSDLQTLHSRGYHQFGKWNLSQNANHLADWMTFPIDGFPKSPWFIRMVVGMMRVTQGKALFRKFAQEQRMAVGQPTIPSTVHPATANQGPNVSNEAYQTASVNRLLSCIDRLTAYRGPLHPSPLFGPLSYDEAVALQLAHCAHHLSFLEPK